MNAFIVQFADRAVHLLGRNAQMLKRTATICAEHSQPMRIVDADCRTRIASQNLLVLQQRRDSSGHWRDAVGHQQQSLLGLQLTVNFSSEVACVSCGELC